VGRLRPDNPTDCVFNWIQAVFGVKKKIHVERKADTGQNRSRKGSVFPVGEKGEEEKKEYLNVPGI